MTSPLLEPEDCRRLFDRVLGAAAKRGVRDVEVLVGGHATALTRFANNTIHQNVAEADHYVSVRPVMDQRTARATTNRLDDEAIEAVVAEAVALAAAEQPDPELPPLAEPFEVPAVDRYFAATAQCAAAGRADYVHRAIAIARASSQAAAGICSTTETVEALLNSNGAFAWHRQTMARFSITAMTDDSSGWAKASSPDLARIDPELLARRAAEKASLSRHPRELPAGRYLVILEPAAVLDVLGALFPDFGATAVHDGRSFLGGRLGAKIFGDNITIHDDVYDPLQDGAPFDGEGVPRRRLTLVERGVPAELAYSRRMARRAGVPPTGHGFPLPNELGEAPEDIVIAGGETPLEEMIASTRRGILVTRLWYIREVDPYEKIMTGMTRDGAFLIKNGEITCGLRNFRFNQSLIEMLSNVKALSPSVRASGEEAIDMVVPAMKVRDFRFSEVTRY